LMLNSQISKCKIYHQMFIHGRPFEWSSIHHKLSISRNFNGNYAKIINNVFAQILEEKPKFANGVYDYILVTSNKLWLKSSYLCTTSRKWQLVINDTMSWWCHQSMDELKYVCIQFHPPYTTTIVWAFTTNLWLFWWHSKSHHVLFLTCDMWQYWITSYFQIFKLINKPNII
jgi:hypothetical protein